MGTQYNDQWILNRINAQARSKRNAAEQRNAWPVRQRQGQWPPRQTGAVGVLGKHPKWIDRDT
jgi:hypothetical protein